ncbi:MAG: hypothetical protein KDA96_03495 [Planctomycetaceae bacterium]|nr:hypothetical protein [Planctomycetaceae bacterium]
MHESQHETQLTTDIARELHQKLEKASPVERTDLLLEAVSEATRHTGKSAEASVRAVQESLDCVVTSYAATGDEAQIPWKEWASADVFQQFDFELLNQHISDVGDRFADAWNKWDRKDADSAPAPADYLLAEDDPHVRWQTWVIDILYVTTSQQIRNAMDIFGDDFAQALNRRFTERPEFEPWKEYLSQLMTSAPATIAEANYSFVWRQLSHQVAQDGTSWTGITGTLNIAWPTRE